MDTRKKTLTFPKGSLWGPCTRMLAPCGASHPLFQHPQRSVHATLPSSSQIQPGGILPEKSSRSSKTLSHGFRVAGAHHTSCVFPHSAPAFTCLVIPTGVVCMWDEPGWEAGCYHCSRSACDFFLCVSTRHFIARLLFHSVFYCTFYYRSLVSIGVRYQGASFSRCSPPVKTGKRCPAEAGLSASGVCMVQRNLKTPGLVYSKSCLQRCSMWAHPAEVPGGESCGQVGSIIQIGSLIPNYL